MYFDNTRNCMGYALGIHAWLFPYDLFNPQHPRTPFDKHQDLDFCTNYLLENYCFLTRISRENAYNAKKGKYIIAFRLAEDDFHFMLRHPNGHWYHKRGAYKIAPIAKEKVFSDAWQTICCRYDSETVFFVRE